MKPYLEGLGHVLKSAVASGATRIGRLPLFKAGPRRPACLAELVIRKLSKTDGLVVYWSKVST